MGEMDQPYEQERREFVRVKLEVPVRYKFLAKERIEPELDHVYEGTTWNISGGGLLLAGRIPVFTWLPDLLLSKILIGVNILLPGTDTPIKALARVAWIETIDEGTKRCGIGLKFREITTADRDQIFQFVIRSQMPS